jgi:O-antigen/teichoic acid export membrane protein
LVAADFVPLVLGDTWRSIVPLLTVLVPFLGLRATLSMTLPCVMALGKTRLLFRVAVIYALVHLPVFILGTVTFGLPGAIWAIVLAGIFYTYLNLWMLEQTVGLSLVDAAAQLRRPAASVAVMAAAIMFVGTTSSIVTGGESALLSLAIKTILGGLVFCTTLYAMWRWEGCPPGVERRLLHIVSR